MEDDLRAALHRYDEAGGLVRPTGYDHAVVRAAFDVLVERLDAEFDTSCRVDRQVEDASLHGRIEIPVEAVRGRAQLVVSVSNFGSMAVVSAENPGAYLDLAEALADHAADSGDLQAVQGILAALGFLVIPEELLTRPYDGISDLASHYPPDRAPDWWIRFFDYL